MAIRIKRSSGDLAPATLASGQLAYVEGAANGGTLYIGEIGGNVRVIGGKKYIDKLDTIEAGAQVNTVNSVAGKTGAVSLVAADITDFSTAADARIAAASLDSLADIVVADPGNGQTLIYNSTLGQWVNAALPSGVTSFVALNDTPGSFSGAAGYWLRVNALGTALEFTQDTDDGVF